MLRERERDISSYIYSGFAFRLSVLGIFGFSRCLLEISGVEIGLVRGIEG
jgi:hypothetical protein